MNNRVLHVVESLRPEAGSVAISLDGLLRSLSALGIESSVLAREGLQGAGDSVAATYDPKRVREAVREASIVHVHGWFGNLALEAAGQSRSSGTPYVISPLGYLCNGPYVDRRSIRHRLRMFLRENKLLSSASAIAAMNSAERGALIAEGVTADPVDLPYGVVFEDYMPSSETGDGTGPAPAEDRTLLILGPIHPIEGFAPFLKAFAEIGADFDGWCVVAGGADVGGCRGELEAAIRRKGGSDRAQFVGADSLDSQRKLLGGAHVLACPSLHYRAAVSIMQAVAAGVAVVASDRAAPDGLAGMVDVCAPTRYDFRDALRIALARTDNQRADMARKAREVARDLYDWSVLGDRYVKLYRSFF